jgi:hypothetical protein
MGSETIRSNTTGISGLASGFKGRQLGRYLEDIVTYDARDFLYLVHAGLHSAKDLHQDSGLVSTGDSPTVR